MVYIFHTQNWDSDGCGNDQNDNNNNNNNNNNQMYRCFSDRYYNNCDNL